MQLCYEHGFLTNEQLRRWMWFEESLKNDQTARSISNRSVNYLRESGFVENCRVKIDIDKDKEPVESVRITESGKQALEDFGVIPKGMALFSGAEGDRKSKDDNRKQYSHDFYLTEIRFLWERLVNRVQWYPDRLFRGWENNQYPDAYVTYFSNPLQDQISLALEVEQTAKSHERYVAKFKAYATEAKYDNILYFSANPNITKLIHEISKGITERIYVCQTDEFLKNRAATRFSSHSDHFIFNERVNCVARK